MGFTWCDVLFGAWCCGHAPHRAPTNTKQHVISEAHIDFVLQQEYDRLRRLQALDDMSLFQKKDLAQAASMMRKAEAGGTTYGTNEDGSPRGELVTIANSSGVEEFYLPPEPGVDPGPEHRHEAGELSPDSSKEGARRDNDTPRDARRTVLNGAAKKTDARGNAGITRAIKQDQERVAALRKLREENGENIGGKQRLSGGSPPPRPPGGGVMDKQATSHIDIRVEDISMAKHHTISASSMRSGTPPLRTHQLHARWSNHSADAARP